MKRENINIKKEQMLQRISELFSDRGYEKTSIRDISKALGITNSGLYYYFKNKQEMLYTIVDDLMERVLVNLRKRLSTIPDPEEKLLCIIQSHIQFFLEYRAQTKVVIYEVYALDERYEKVLEKKQAEYINFVKGVLKEIIRTSGTSPELSVATFSLLGMLNWTIKWYKPEGRVSPETLARNILGFVLRGLKG